ncbi:MAG: alkaline phosphatase family protein [Candidatus Micrarchaeaceae archaeon]
MGKYLLIILDGAADRGNSALGGRTPLEAALMPNIDALSKNSFEGMMYPIARGVAPESDAAVFSILGYDIKKEYTGRGPLEAYGAGLEVTDDTVAFRCNFATINNKREIIDRRAGRNVTKKEAKELEAEIRKIKINGVKIVFKATVGHRGVLTMRGLGFRLSPNVSNADVGYVKTGKISVAVKSASKKLPEVEPLDSAPESKATASIVNEFIEKCIGILKKSNVNKARRKKGVPEANTLLIRDAGMGLPNVVPLDRKYGIRSAFVAEMPVERGIAKVLGMHELRAKGRLYDYSQIVPIIKSGFKNYNFIYVHIKGPDEPGHDGDAIRKKGVLEKIDREFFGTLAKAGINATVCVTSDHSTPCTLKAHSSDPVPVMIKPFGFSGSDKMHFDERIDSKGSIGVIKGKELIKNIMRLGSLGSQAPI